MQTTNHRPERSNVDRLRKLLVIFLMLAALPLLAAACGGGGGDQGGGKGGDQAGKGGGGGTQQAGNGGGKKGGGTGKGGGGTGQDKVVSDPRYVFALPDQKVLNGQRARFRGVQVRQVVGERAFFVGENDAERLLVVAVGDQPPKVTEGQDVTVAGRLNTPRPELEQKLSLSPQEVSAMNDQKIFLRAARVTPAKG